MTNAGLHRPRLHTEALVGTDPTWTGHTQLAELLDTLRPTILEHHIATADQINPAQLTERLRAHTAEEGVVLTWGHMTAWAHKPG